MPYLVEGNCVKKKNEDGSAGETVKCHDSPEAAKRHMRALYANVHDSAVVEMPLVITKAAFDKSTLDPHKKRRIVMTNSDTLPDLYEESMSLELFKDFTERIENKTPVPEVFRSYVCEDEVWCGGMPYLSIAHYDAGRHGKNLPGDVDSVFIDGKQLKSKAYLRDTPLGRALFDSICADEEIRRSGAAPDDHKPVRISIGFLDFEHDHIVEGKTITFARTGIGQKCDLCASGVGGKIYKKGQLIHLATTRVPVNPRTSTELEEKSMGDEIITKKDDAASIVGEELASELEQRSLADDVLVVKGDVEQPIDDGLTNQPSALPFASCYDPNTNSFNQPCIDASMRAFMAAIRNEMNTVKSDAADRLFGEVAKSLNSELQGTQPVVEESMDEKVIEKEEEAKEEQKQEKSALDAKFEELKSLLATRPTVDQVQAAYAAIGSEVEKSYTPPAPAAGDLAEIVKAAVAEAVKPLAIEVAQLKAARADEVLRSQQHPISRALTLKPEQLVQKSQKPVRQMSQIERIARMSTGASVE